MLGVVFTEFMEMVEDEFSFDVADEIMEISGVGVETGFTAVQEYSHTDMVKLVAALHKVTGMEIDALITAFGQHLFQRFTVTHSQFFSGSTCSLDFLENIEGYIHVEVKKLYPNAELPTFRCIRHAPDKLEMNYKSKRPFGDLAHGLIRGCGAHFKDDLEIERTDQNGPHEVQFMISRERPV
jgi:5'-3' exonuclease